MEQLCTSAHNNEIDKCITLITKQGVDIQSLDTAGYSALHYAICSGHVELVRVLLEYGADASGYVSGISAIEIAGRYGQLEVYYYDY